MFARPMPARACRYGPAIYDGMSYFKKGDFPDNMPAVWDDHYGRRGGDAPIVIGETGGSYEGKDRQWQDRLIQYAAERGIGVFCALLPPLPSPSHHDPTTCACFRLSHPAAIPDVCGRAHCVFCGLLDAADFALNPDPDDATGLLNDDWTTMRPGQLSLLSRLPSTKVSVVMPPPSPPLPPDPSPPPPPSPPPECVAGRTPLEAKKGCKKGDNPEKCAALYRLEPADDGDGDGDGGGDAYYRCAWDDDSDVCTKERTPCAGAMSDDKAARLAAKDAESAASASSSLSSPPPTTAGDDAFVWADPPASPSPAPPPGTPLRPPPPFPPLPPRPPPSPHPEKVWSSGAGWGTLSPPGPTMGGGGSPPSASASAQGGGERAASGQRAGQPGSTDDDDDRQAYLIMLLALVAGPLLVAVATYRGLRSDAVGGRTAEDDDDEDEDGDESDGDEEQAGQAGQADGVTAADGPRKGKKAKSRRDPTKAGRKGKAPKYTDI